MCGRFLLISSGHSIAERFQLADEPEILPRYNIAPTQSVAVISRDADDHRRHVKLLKWGLVPSWAKDSSTGYRMINARAETAAEKPAFRAAFKRRRCLIPADGFYEWKKAASVKQPYLVAMTDKSPFAMAGLWEHWEGGGGIIESCAILTTEANELVGVLHDRMPVILHPKDFDLWLDPSVNKPEVLKGLLKPYPADRMTSYPVNPKVNKAAYDGPDIIEPASTTVEA